MAEKEKKPGLFAKMGRSFRDMRGELKKVVWPNKKQIVNNTAIVIAFVAVAGVFLGGLDAILSLLVRLVLQSY